MAYEDLTDDEKIEFHLAIVNKHQQALADVYAKKNAITDGEKAEREKIVSAAIAVSIDADDFKRPISEISLEPIPTEKETIKILKGEK